MCGIAGVFSRQGVAPDPGILQRMTRALMHRGPDAEGFYREGPIGFGHRRLSVIDPGPGANQPFTDASGRYVLIYNGELYNYRALRETITGIICRTTSDTEVLAESFARQGTGCVDAILGMFAFAVWDREKETLYLCRDRFGVKPLYYYEADGSFVFASELRALLASGLVPRKLNAQALPGFLSTQSFNCPESPVSGVHQVEPGTWLIVDRNGIAERRYWSLFEAATQDEIAVGAGADKEIARLLSQAVQRRMVSDVPVAAFLSGGIDSSMVVGMMSGISAQPPATFTIAFRESAYDESAYAEMVARRYKTNHTTIRLHADDVLHSLDEALDAMDSPSGDGINTFLLSRQVRQNGIKVALSGLGGDELFGRYPLYARYRSWQKWKFLFDHTRVPRQLVSGLIGRLRAVPAHRLSGLLATPRMDIAHMYPEMRRILSPQAITALTTLQWSGELPVAGILAQHREALDRMPVYSRLSVAEYMGYTANTLLKDTDQMGMASSLEIREPFFDHELVSYMLRVPDAVKQRGPALAKTLLPDMPDVVLQRPKQGFLFPWREWMKGPLREFCDMRIRRMSARGFVREAALLEYWNRFLNGDRRIRWTEPWLFIVLEHWLEKNHVEA